MAVKVSAPINRLRTTSRVQRSPRISVARAIGQYWWQRPTPAACAARPAVSGSQVELDGRGAPRHDVEVRRHVGVARFDSIESMVRAEIRGWTFSDTIDDEQYERLLVATGRR